LVAATYAWRFVLLSAALAITAHAAARVELGLRRPAATTATFVVGLTVLGTMAWFIYDRLTAGVVDVQAALRDGAQSLLAWLENSPLGCILLTLVMSLTA